METVEGRLNVFQDLGGEIFNCFCVFNLHAPLEPYHTATESTKPSGLLIFIIIY